MVVLLLTLAGCSREPEAVRLPPPPSSTLPPPPPPPSEVGEFAFRIHKDVRSPTRLACWGCYQKARDAVKMVNGVSEVLIYPDSAVLVVRYVRTRLRDLADVVIAIKKALPEVETESLGEAPPISTRVRLTREIPEPLRPAFEKAADGGSLVVVRCSARACGSCEAGEPASWGEGVIRAVIDLDETPAAKVWLAPEAVPEWIVYDRRGNELGRWRGHVDAADMERRLPAMRARAQ